MSRTTSTSTSRPHTFTTDARHVWPAMGLELDGRRWFVRDVKDDRGRRTFTLEETTGAAVGRLPVRKRTHTTGLMSPVRALSW